MNTLEVGRAQVRLGLAGALLLMALLLLTATLTLCLVPGAGNKWIVGWGTGSALALATSLLLLGVVVLRRGLALLPAADILPEPDKSSTLFGRHLVGIGFALLADALVNVVVVAVLAWRMSNIQEVLASRESGLVKELHGDAFDAGPLDSAVIRVSANAGDVLARFFGRTEAESFAVVLLLVMSTLVALLGALFFFATSMWTKMQQSDQELFDRSTFWAGLWFRIGEAVVFNLVFFFMLRLYAPDQYLLLPLVSLLIGMFLKSGEQLVTGLATRFFAAFEALLPIERAPTISFRLFEALLKNLPDDLQTRQQAIAALLDDITALQGVDRTAVDASLMLRVRYNPDKIKVDEIKQVITLQGYLAE